MALKVALTSQFKRDYKGIQKQGLDLKKLQSLIDMLIAQAPLTQRYKDHPLKGNRKGYRECHIEQDWLLIYRVVGDELQLAETGSHADLFD